MYIYAVSHFTATSLSDYTKLPNFVICIPLPSLGLKALGAKYKPEANSRLHSYRAFALLVGVSEVSHRILATLHRLFYESQKQL